MCWDFRHPYVRKYAPIQELHYVEWCPNDWRVFAQNDRRRYWDPLIGGRASTRIIVMQCFQYSKFAFDLVGSFCKEFPSWLLPQHETCFTVCSQVSCTSQQATLCLPCVRKKVCWVWLFWDHSIMFLSIRAQCKVPGRTVFRQQLAVVISAENVSLDLELLHIDRSPYILHRSFQVLIQVVCIKTSSYLSILSSDLFAGRSGHGG